MINKRQQLPWHSYKRWGQRDVKNIDKIIIHQELGNASVDAVNSYHISDNNHVSDTGCPHFCYHYGIEKDGDIIIANNQSDITWHTKGQNETGIGIMLVGEFKKPGHYNRGDEAPTDAQMKALHYLVTWLQGQLLIPANNVFGHCHFGKPACPGEFVENWITRNFR